MTCPRAVIGLKVFLSSDAALTSMFYLDDEILKALCIKNPVKLDCNCYYERGLVRPMCQFNLVLMKHLVQWWRRYGRYLNTAPPPPLPAEH